MCHFPAFIYYCRYHQSSNLRNRAFERQAARSFALVLLARLRLGGGLLLLLGGVVVGSLLHAASSRRRSTVARRRLRLLLLSCAALQSLEVDLGHGLVEGLALGLGDFEFLLGRLAGAVAVLFGFVVSILVDPQGLHSELTAKEPAPQALPPRTSELSPSKWKVVL